MCGCGGSSQQPILLLNFELWRPRNKGKGRLCRCHRCGFRHHLLLLLLYQGRGAEQIPAVVQPQQLFRRENGRLLELFAYQAQIGQGASAGGAPGGRLHRKGGGSGGGRCGKSCAAVGNSGRQGCRLCDQSGESGVQTHRKIPAARRHRLRLNIGVCQRRCVVAAVVVP